jgi:hypothetical protein
MRPLPEDGSATNRDIAIAINEIVRSVGQYDPSLNDRIGQIEPEPKDSPTGKLAFSDGLSWVLPEGEGTYRKTSTGIWEKV